MEGYSGAPADNIYDEFQLDDATAEDTHTRKVVNLDDEPVAKVLLPSIKDKKQTTIKINLHNPGTSRNKSGSNDDKRVVSVEPVQKNRDVGKGPSYSSNKKEDSQELRRLFNLTIEEENGKRVTLFTHDYSHGHRVTCRACKISCTSESNLIQHARGKRHISSLEALEEAERKRKGTVKQEPEEPEPRRDTKMDMSEDVLLAPGEPVPPGFEDEIRLVPMCQEMLDTFTDSPLIGLEYLVELMAEDPENSQVVCFLCDKRGETRWQNVRGNIISHAIGTSHRLSYIKKFFPTVGEALQKVGNDRERKMDSGRLVRNVVQAIEADYGRLRPHAIEKNKFEFSKEELKRKLEDDKHFTETPQNTYVHIVNPEKKASPFDRLGDRKLDSESRERDWRNRDPPARSNRPRSVDRDESSREQPPRQEVKAEVKDEPLGEGGQKRASEEQIKQEQDVECKKSRADDPLRDTTPISLSSGGSMDSISLSSSGSVERSRSPGARRRSPRRAPRARSSRSPPARRPRNYRNYNDNQRFNRNGNGRRDFDNRFDRQNRSRSPPNRSRSPRNRSRSPHNRSRSPRFVDRERSPPRFRRVRSPNPRRRPRSRSGSPGSRRVGSESRSPVRMMSGSPKMRSKSPSIRSVSPASDLRSSWLPLGRGRNRSRDRTTSRNDSREKSEESDGPLNKRDKWIKFREEADAMEVEMEDLRQFHQKNPEKHPLYNDEWKKFWNMRYKELQAQGKDPNKHDFKSEWIPFWNKKMEALHTDEFKLRKDSLKKKYDLKEEEDIPEYNVRNRIVPMQRAEPDDPRYGFAGRDGGPPHQGSRERDHERGGSVADVKDTWKALTGSEIHHEPPPPRPRSPSWFPPNNRREQFNRGGHFAGSGNFAGPHHFGRRTGLNEESYKITNVLRLLTALESQLGSFGPKINTLLAQAISMEKKQTNSSEDLARNMDNIVLFESIREKFRGALMAGVVERGNVNATRLAITHLGDLLARAPPPSVADPIPNIKPRPTATVTAPAPVLAPAPVPVAAAAVAVPGVGTIDRSAIAMQLTEALIAQGRTNITEEELQSLISAVIGIAQQKAAETSAPPPVQPPAQQPKEGASAKLAALARGPGPSEVQVKAEDSGGLKALQSAYNKSPPPSKSNNEEAGTSRLSSVEEIGDLSEADLKACLRIFRHLSGPEQRSLILYLKKLEDSDPDRVVTLRKYVNLGSGTVVDDEPPVVRSSGRPSSPFAKRHGGANPYINESLHDSDEDYSFDEVAKAAARNVEQKKKAEDEKKRAEELAEKKKRDELLAKMKILSKPADNNAIRQAIDATTDAMMASISNAGVRGNTSGSKTHIPGLSQSNDIPGFGSSTQTTSGSFPMTSAISTLGGPRAATSTVKPRAPPPSLATSTMPVAGFMAVPASAVGVASYVTQSYTTMPPTTQQPAYVGYTSVQYPEQGGFVTGPIMTAVPAVATVSYGQQPFYQYQQDQYAATQDQYAAQAVPQQVAQQPAVQQQPQQAYPPQSVSYHPAQYSASYEKRQQSSRAKGWPRN